MTLQLYIGAGYHFCFKSPNQTPPMTLQLYIGAGYLYCFKSLLVSIPGIVFTISDI